MSSDIRTEILKRAYADQGPYTPRPTNCTVTWSDEWDDHFCQRGYEHPGNHHSNLGAWMAQDGQPIDGPVEGEPLEAVHVGFTTEQNLRALALDFAFKQVGDCGLREYAASGVEDLNDDPFTIEHEIAAGARITALLADHYQRYLTTGEIPAVVKRGERKE